MGRPPARGGAEQLVRGLALAATLCAAASAGATTYYVDNSSPGCSDSGPGTLSTPYCSIGAALAAHHGSGTTIQVQPGIYREEIHVPGSGASGSPLVIRAGGPAGQVVMEGAEDYGSASLWSPAGGSTWRAPSVSWNPVQVFADGARLAPSTGPPSSMPSGTFHWIAGQGLYVNVGGGNPGDHGALVGQRQYGFYVGGQTWVTIQGFAVRHYEQRGIRMTRSSDASILDNLVQWCASYGILADSSSGITIRSNTVTDNGYHGIGLIAHASQCTVENNESARNRYPPQRLANGIYLYSASDNVLSNNRLHDNQDTGGQFSSGSNRNLSLQNCSWNNGDHGYDHLQCSGNVHIGDVAWGNYKDGFSIEGSAVNHQVWNCIGVDNGLTTNEFDLWVDGTSTSGFQSDDNLFWNSTSQAPVKYITTLYTSVPAYGAATGHDLRTVQADPQFVNPAQGDFHLGAGSPAIDNANSSVTGWPSLDAGGNARSDDAAVPNTGLGPVPYADRGAFEYQGGAAAVTQPSGTQSPPPRITPNPLRGTGSLLFSTLRPGTVQVEILDAAGRRVRTVAAGETGPGAHVLAFDGIADGGAPLGAGLYWVVIRSPDGLARGRFVVMR